MHERQARLLELRLTKSDVFYDAAQVINKFKPKTEK